MRVLLYLDGDFQGFEREALMSEPFGHEYRKDLQKIAIVGGSWWLNLEMKLITPFLSGELRNFARSELPEAWTWVRR